MFLSVPTRQHILSFEETYEELYRHCGHEAAEQDDADRLDTGAALDLLSIYSAEDVVTQRLTTGYL
jgi:hypothetical protein